MECGYAGGQRAVEEERVGAEFDLVKTLTRRGGQKGDA